MSGRMFWLLAVVLITAWVLLLTTVGAFALWMLMALKYLAYH